MRSSLILVLTAGLLACGDSSFTPDDGTVPTPVQGAPGAPLDIGLPDMDPPDFAAAADGFSTQGCCDVTFAIAGTDQVAYVRLRGSGLPFAEGAGHELTHSAGVWSGSLCVPPGYIGFYYYEFGLIGSGDAGTIPDPRANAFAPTQANTEFGTVNAFPPAADCAGLNAAQHAVTGP